MDDRDAECARLCRESQRLCLETAIYLSTSNRPVEAAHLRLFFSCAELCHTSAGLLVGDAHLARRATSACAELLDRCARICDEFGDDPTLRACADACRRCAEACYQLAPLAA
jgi:hypothetical protein